MKKMLTFLLLLMPCAVFAQQAPTDEQKDHCMKIGLAYQMASTGRDSNWPPELALKTIIASSAAGISQEQGKRIVNQVYFDPSFVNAGGRALANQVYSACLYPHGYYKPLK